MADLIKGDKVITPQGHTGEITRITKSGIAWVKVRARWGGFSKPVRYKTFRLPIDELKQTAGAGSGRQADLRKPVGDNLR